VSFGFDVIIHIHLLVAAAGDPIYRLPPFDLCEFAGAEIRLLNLGGGTSSAQAADVNDLASTRGKK
jgi:hypothetical protein